MPAVSVIIPAYNSAMWICDALDSVFAQTYKDFEVILINDGSTDTEAFERAIAPYRERMVYLKQENRGPSGARNAGIQAARGRYLAFLDSDDAWYPSYLAEQMRILEETPSLDLVYCDVLHYTDSVSTGAPYMQQFPSTGPVSFESLVKEDCAIPTSNTVVRRQAVLDAGLFDENFRRSEDFDLWLRLAHRGARMTYQEKLLGRHRVRRESLAGDNVKLLEGMLQVLRKVDRSLELAAGTRAVLQRKILETRAHYDLEQGKRCLYEGNVREAAEFLKSANGFFGRTKLRVLLLGLKIAPGWISSGVRDFEKWRAARRR